MEDAMEVEETYEQRAMINAKKHRRVAYRLTKKKGQQEQSALMQLPNEIFELIVHKLSRPDDALRFMASCRLAYNRVRRDARFWGRFYPKLYFIKTPVFGAQHRREETSCPYAQELFRTLASASGVVIAPGKEVEAINGAGSRSYRYWNEACSRMCWNMSTRCTNPKHYPRTVRTPKTELPADPFDSVCKALSKKNLAEYRNAAQFNYDQRLRQLEHEKREVEQRLEVLKRSWVDTAARAIEIQQKKEKFQEKKEKALPFIDLSKFETSS
ncbi:hypothetical protein [Yaravirus sp. 'brasiliensis']|uniref:F-box domain-containing protein n=1 Tax=Yaravirus sp. 'brasiliensis' TaxID=2739681 RepID=A0AAE7E2V7_9VIRU|nr:hypothetical protein QKS73_gp43 [Yaravirus brasiliensis]QKE44434.1 hypothetical protein [Yaravirus brasiliensis]